MPATRQQWKIAVLPGDGIGPEVMDQALAALDVLRGAGLSVTWGRFEWPSTAWHRDHGEIWPDDWKQQLANYDAILLGALGDPGPTSNRDRYVLSDGVSLSPLLEIRKGFDQWACERPARLLPGAPQYLADPRAAAIDMLVVRENSEGEYVGHGGRLAIGTPHEMATQISVFTRRGTERIFRHAFERARQRSELRHNNPREFPSANGSRKAAASQVCLVTKRNALQHWGEMHTAIFAEVARDYPDVATHHELLDAACMKFVTAPWAFDVVVASNLQGDILTDLAAVLSGGMGIAPSCNLNPDDRHRPPMFEPTHGSAPDIAGQDLAGPQAMLLTTAMMLDWMGEEDARAAECAQQLRQAVADDLVENRGKQRRCSETGQAICARLQAMQS
jgi:tartrate dehydrogenase/decarboxylase/D-malate dehydrogenase